MAARQELHFRIGRTDIGLIDVQAAAKEAWKQMREPGTVPHANALALGIDPQTLPKQLGSLIVLRPDGAGITTVDLIVTVASTVGVRAGWDLWKYVVLAHIRDRWGDHALKEKRTARRRAAAKNKRKRSKPLGPRDESAELASHPARRASPQGERSLAAR